MLISRSTCPILEKRTSKQPKNTRWMSETPESDTQSVAPLEFLRKMAGSRMAPSYGSPQGFLPPRVAPLEFPTENGGATRRFEVAQVLV